MNLQRLLRPEHRYVVLGLCCMCFSLYHSTRQVILPALPIIKEQMNLTYSETGWVVAAYNLGYSGTLFFGGYFADLFKRKPLILGGVVALAFTLFLTTLSRNFIELTGSRILSGFAFGLYFAPAIGLITAYFSKEERGAAVSFHTGVGAGSGRFIAPLLSGVTLVAFGWQFLFYVSAALAIVVAFLFWRIVREPASGQKGSLLPIGTVVRQVVLNRFLIILGICNGTITAAVTVTAGFLPLWLVNNLGLDVSFGAYSVALLNGVGIPMVTFWGWLSDRVGRKPVIIGVVFMSATTLFFLNRLTTQFEVVVGIVVAGLFTGSAFPIIITYVVDVMPTVYRSASIGTVNMFTTFTSSMFAVSAGYFSDAFGIAMVFPFLAAISVVGALIVFGIRPVESTPARAPE
ncbi:MAG: MFS transporter [Chloroflexi bacterium]|nr:MFS transporter [Chloroflexota bacterium]